MTNEKNKPAPGKKVGCKNKSTQKVSPQVKTGITVFKKEVMDITCTNAENYAIRRLIYFMSFESCLESGQFISWNMSNTWIHLLFMTVGTHDISYMTSNARWSECNLLCNADTSGLIECYIWHVGIILMICRKKKHINEAKIPMSYTKIPICLHKFSIQIEIIMHA